MGANSSKGDSPEEEECKMVLLKMFNVSLLNEIGVIDKSKLEKIWSPILVDELIVLYSTYFERKILSRKKSDDKKILYSIYSVLAKGNNSEVAEMLCCIFNLKSKGGTPEGFENFNIEELEKYISCLISSFLKCLDSENDKKLHLWSEAQIGFDKELKKSVVNFLIKDLKTDDNLISIENMEKWLIRCPLFSTLQSLVMKRAFCYFDKLGPNQELLAMPDFSIVTKTKLDVHHVIYLTNSLLPELRIKWRLLFSSRYSGESWVIFLKNVVDQGPTLIFVWDKNGNCFGGFASSSWSLSPHFYGDDNCFLFTLLPTLDKFEPTNYNKNFQYINTAQVTFPNGLGMGGQLNFWGLYIDSSMKFGKTSVTCSTFANYKQPAEETFEIEDIEVWGVGEKPVLIEPGTRQRSALDTQTEAKAVLEMMGKSQVSEGLREPDPEDE